MVKKCSKCKDFKDIELFNKNKRKPDGRSTECRVCVNNYNEQYRVQHKAETKLYNKQYRISNATTIAEQAKVYAATHPEIETLRKRKYYLRHTDLIKERTREAKKQNPKRYQAYNSKRRAIILGAYAENITEKDIINKYGDVCFYCSKLFEQIDHYIPLSKGGSHTLENVRPSCEKCNLTKNNKLPAQWEKYKKAMRS